MVGALNVYGIEIPWEARTLDGFRAWVATLDEHGPSVSFARGRMHVVMSPQSRDTHEPLVVAINMALRGLGRELDIGRYFLPPSWFTHEPSALSTEPDGFFVSWSSLESEQLRINPERRIEMLNHPDMVLEVVSDSSQRKDLVEHVEDYALADVREYWIVDARGAAISFQVLVLGPDKSYVESPIDADGFIRSHIWQRQFRVRELPTRANLRDFILEIRP